MDAAEASPMLRQHLHPPFKKAFGDFSQKLFQALFWASGSSVIVYSNGLDSDGAPLECLVMDWSSGSSVRVSSDGLDSDGAPLDRVTLPKICQMLPKILNYVEK